MAATASQIANSYGVDWEGALRAAQARSAVGNVLAGDDLTARALGGAGLAALLLLPLLLLASVILSVPLAVPAALGLGYLATSRALAAKHRRRAALINASVLSALVGWLLTYIALADGSATNAGLAAALMTPLLAAAPAFARAYLRTRERRAEIAAAHRRDAISEWVKWMNEVTPRDQVLILSGEGRVLAATAAACAKLGSRELLGCDVRSVIASDDVGPLLGEIRRCLGGGGRVDVSLSFRGDFDPNGHAPLNRRKGDVRLAGVLAACGEGLVAMRIKDDATCEPPLQSSQSERPTASRSAIDSKEGIAPSCDIGDAAGFAFRHAMPKAKAMRVGLGLSVEPDIVAACDRQTGRRITQRMIECALHGCQPNGSVEVLARKTKGVALLRAASRLRNQEFAREEEADNRLDTASLRALVEAIGGTLVVDREGDDIILSVRLDLAVGQLRNDAWGQNVLAA